MKTFRPTEIHQFAIQAKLNFALGARVYDEIFAGFEVTEIVGDELRGWATSEYRAAVIDIHFSAEVARIAQAVTGQPVRRTSFLLRGLRHDTERQPAWDADAGAIHLVASFATTSKRRALLARHKGVRSLRMKLLRSRS
ncbi:hypothetical protein [Bradyrhizobium sp.]|uniref:hypothetical protein n=1 Tax=Bradyrhizobium sp. TaxID=376 RepID=UPI001E0025D6|nr:hypothetical protein [Bradyrhizobium sp.]MBI5322066.1 hypothetical protein [Bradyrhizobium sp.]